MKAAPLGVEAKEKLLGPTRRAKVQDKVVLRQLGELLEPRITANFPDFRQQRASVESI